MQELFQSFPGVLRRLEGNDLAISAIVFAAWRRTAGENLRQRTEPVGFRQKRLTLAVENAIWKRHLEDLSGDMLYRLNAKLGQGVVNFIEFRVDEHAVLNAPDRRKLTSAEDDTSSAISPELKQAAMRITDPKLRERFLSAAGAYLSRQ
ncbi:MAG: DUF721 domain-containing protein [Acidobacteriota bacterium]